MAGGWPSDIQGVRPATRAEDGATAQPFSSNFDGGRSPAADMRRSMPERHDARAVLMENGGGVALLPGDSFDSDPPWVVGRAPLEVTLTGVQERWFARHGFFTLSRVPHTARAAFYSVRMARAPRAPGPRAIDNASDEFHSLLPYILTAARFAQWLKVFGRGKHGVFQSAADLQAELQDMLGRYKGTGMPLSDARVTVREDGAGGFACSLAISPRLSAEDVEVIGTIPLEIQVVNPPMSGVSATAPTTTTTTPRRDPLNAS
jgi:predicted component of type VI protein secretion system